MSIQFCSSRCRSVLFAQAAIGAIALAGMATSASAYTITFDSIGLGFFPSYSEGGATITATDLTLLTATAYGSCPNGTQALASDNSAGNFAPLRADFSSTMTAVSVDLGDFDSDSDDIYLDAYNAGGTLVASDMFFLDVDFTGMHTLSVAAPDIAYVIFGGVGVQNSSVYADNLTFVPAPGAAAFLGIGGLLAARRRRA